MLKFRILFARIQSYVFQQYHQMKKKPIQVKFVHVAGVDKFTRCFD